MTISSGTSFGPYEIRSALGAGGMGEVYRAHDKRLRRDVALKLLPEGYAQPGQRQRFIQEARAASALNHPNIVSVYDINVESVPPYIVSELVEGTSLRGVLARGALPLRRLLEIAVQIADGLSAAHQAGIVHRDLKPDNLIVGRDGRVKILDFGVAKQMHGPAPAGPEADTIALSITRDGVVLGTAQYMSPEQARGKDVDTRSDIFTFGLLLYEMATGRRPFNGQSAVDVMTAILRDDLPPIETPIPVTLRWTIEGCLIKEPAERRQSMRDVYHELKQQLDYLSQSTVAAAEFPGTRPAARGKRRWPAAAALAAPALLAGLLAGVFVGAPDTPRLAAGQFRPLATGQGTEDGAAWSPDGNSIAYYEAAGGHLQIFTRSLDATTPLQVTRCEVDCTSPQWSPDGARLFFLTQRGLWSVGAAGGEPQKVLDVVDMFALSGDGKTVAFVRRESTNPPSFSVLTSSPPGAEPVEYKPNPFKAYAYSGIRLAFAPDGRQLLLAVGAEGRNSEYWLLPVPAGGPQPKRIWKTLRHSFPNRGVSWMPDGRHVVMACTVAPEVYRSHLFLADVRTDELHPLVSGAGVEAMPAVSRDGRRLAYTAMDIDSDIVEIPLDGSPPRTLLATNRYEHSPSWSPVARELAYVTDRSGLDEIWIKSFDGRWERPLVTPRNFPDGAIRFLNAPVFSPDGERVAFMRNGEGWTEIWVTSSAGGSPVLLTDAPGSKWAPSWSPDGKWLAFYGLGPRTGLMKVRVGAREPPSLLHSTKGACNLCTPDWSPRGDWISYSTEQGSVLVPAEGGEARFLRKPQFLAAGWSHDGGTLYGLSREEGRLRIKAVDIDSGKERLVSEMPAGLLLRPLWFPGLRLSLAPGGGAVATSSMRLAGDIWMVENFSGRPSLLSRLGLRSR